MAPKTFKRKFTGDEGNLEEEPALKVFKEGIYRHRDHHQDHHHLALASMLLRRLLRKSEKIF